MRGVEGRRKEAIVKNTRYICQRSSRKEAEEKEAAPQQRHARKNGSRERRASRVMLTPTVKSLSLTIKLLKLFSTERRAREREQGQACERERCGR